MAVVLVVAGCSDSITKMRSDGATASERLPDLGGEDLGSVPDFGHPADSIQPEESQTDAASPPDADAAAGAADTPGDPGRPDITTGSLDLGLTLGDASSPLDVSVDVEWPSVERWTGTLATPADDVAYAVAADGIGNAFVVGGTRGQLEFNATSSYGYEDLFVAKYSPSGGNLWIRQIGTMDETFAFGVATDGDGSAYVVGYTAGALGGNLNAGGKDLFVMKYDGNGTRQWTRVIGTSADDVAEGVAADKIGNVYVAGHTTGGLDGNVGAGGADVFVVKYDTNGVKQWSSQMGTSADDLAYGVAADGTGNVFVAGYTNGDFDGLVSNGKYDAFVVKYDSRGNKQWTRLIGSAGSESAYGVATDTAGNILIVGATNGDIDGNVNMGGVDFFLAKYDTGGGKQWIRQMGSSAAEYARGVAVDSRGAALVVGYTQGGLDGNVNAGAEDIFVAKYDSDGTKRWTRQMGSSTNDEGRGISVDSGDGIFVAGFTQGNLDGQVNAGPADAFVMKLIE